MAPRPPLVSSDALSSSGLAAPLGAPDQSALNAVACAGRLIEKHWLARLPLVGSVAPTHCCEAKAIAVKRELPSGVLALAPLLEDRGSLVIRDILIAVLGDSAPEEVLSLTSFDCVIVTLYGDEKLQDFGPASVAAELRPFECPHPYYL